MTPDDSLWADEGVPLYTLTGGRTNPEHSDLDMATLVMANPNLPATTLEPEHWQVLALCRTWRAVAEIAAGLRVPLAVAKVQVSDLISRHAITLPAPGPSVLPPHRDPVVLRRFRDGLKALA